MNGPKKLENYLKLLMLTILHKIALQMPMAKGTDSIIAVNYKNNSVFVKATKNY
jgi:hypothetical protein